MNAHAFRTLLLLLALVPAACRPEPPATAGAPPMRTTADGPHVYAMRGRLVDVRQEGHVAVIAHEAVPGYMPAMTMSFIVRTPAELTDLAPGNAVAFRYVVDGIASWITDLYQLPEEEAETLVLAEEPDYAEPPPASLYVLDAPWTNQNGHTLRLGALRGRPVLLAMVFTRCTYACPLIVRDMKRIGARLPASLQDRVHYVLVSLDPEHDTPAALRRFAEGHGLAPDRWTLLRGDTEQVRLLAALLGIRSRRQADGQLAHTNLITLLNEHGEIVHRQKGLGHDGSQMAQRLIGLLQLE